MAPVCLFTDSRGIFLIFFSYFSTPHPLRTALLLFLSSYVSKVSKAIEALAIGLAIGCTQNTAFGTRALEQFLVHTTGIVD